MARVSLRFRSSDAVALYAASEVGAFVEPRVHGDCNKCLLTGVATVFSSTRMWVGAETRHMVAACLATDKAVVLDADALTSFEQSPQDLSKRSRADGRLRS